MKERLIRGSCSDCGVAIGVPHLDGCDIARCLVTGIQRIQCGGELHEYKGRTYGEHDGDCGEETWSGEWPGVKEARERGLYCYWGPPWIPCGPDHPEATEDLNRLIMQSKWDREQAKWVAV